MRNTLRLFVLLLVKRDVIVFGDVLKWTQQIVSHVLLALFLFDNNRPFDVQVILFFQNIVEGRISAPINANLLKFVSKMVLNWLLFEGLTLDYHIVFPFQNKTVEDKVLLLQKIGLLKETNYAFGIYIIITFFNVHCHKI